MNERIRQLAEQAGLKIPVHTEYNGHIYRNALEKFAELIVRECIGVIDGGRFLHDQAPTALFAKECSSAIKRHFGVEETKREQIDKAMRAAFKNGVNLSGKETP
jgi:hypothetical protein